MSIVSCAPQIAQPEAAGRNPRGLEKILSVNAEPRSPQTSISLRYELLIRHSRWATAPFDSCEYRLTVGVERPPVARLDARLGDRGGRLGKQRVHR